MPTIISEALAAKEHGLIAFDVSFTDEDGNPVTPTALTWSLYDEDQQAVVNSRLDEAVASPQPTITIVLQGDDLAILHDRPEPNSTEWRYLLVKGTYNGSLGDDLPLVNYVKFPIIPVPGSTP